MPHFARTTTRIISPVFPLLPGPRDLTAGSTGDSSHLSEPYRPNVSKAGFMLEGIGLRAIVRWHYFYRYLI
jgi:hypothetical protein